MTRLLCLTSVNPLPECAPSTQVNGAAVGAGWRARVRRRWTIRHRQEDAGPRVAAPAVLPVRAHRVQFGSQRPDALDRYGGADAALFDQAEEAGLPLVAGGLGRRFREGAAARAAAPRWRLERLRRRPRAPVVRIERAHVPEHLLADRQILGRVDAGPAAGVLRNQRGGLLGKRVGV